MDALPRLPFLSVVLVSIWWSSVSLPGASTAATAPGWTVETVEAAQAVALDLALDVQGRPLVVFRDELDGDCRVLRREHGGTWTDLQFPYSGFHLQVDVDPTNGLPYVLFVERSSTDLVLAWKVGNFWTSLEAMSDDGVMRFDFEILDGTVHIAYTTLDGAIRYHHFDPGGISWTALTLDTVTGAEPPRVSIALRQDGIPRIAYNRDGVLYYATTSDMVVWSSQIVDDTADRVGLFPSLALGSSDNPSISYHDDTNADLKVAFYNSVAGTWALPTIDGDESATGELTSMVLDPESDYPRVAYRGFDCGVCLVELVGPGTWSRTEIAGDESGERKLVTDAEGRLLLLYAESESPEVRLAIDVRRIFGDGFESGTTEAWAS